jgi:restriction endonuclease S subunit
MSTLASFYVTIPSCQEQVSIATFLDHETAKIDALIAEQQRLIVLLQEKRQAVISHAVTKGLNPDAPMKDSGVEWLGEVPEHWEIKKLKHLLSQPLSYGANEPADSSDPELPRYIRITDIQEDGTLNADTFRSLPAEKAEPYMLIDKDMLLARSGATVGKAFLYKREFGPCCFAGYLILARLEARDSLPEWFRLFTESSAYWGQVKSDAIQATIQNVSAEKYGNIFIPVPPEDELVGIVRETKSLVEHFNRTVSAAKRSIFLLHERRSALISAAVTGQIDVRGLVPEASAA